MITGVLMNFKIQIIPIKNDGGQVPVSKMF